MMVEFEHSPLGGSAASRFLKCGASFLLQRLLMLHGEYEEPLSSEFADKGVAAHLLGAECLIEDAEPFEYIGEKIGNYHVHPDDLDPEAVAVYVNYCNSVRHSEASRRDATARTLIEQTYHLREVHPLFKGTVDFAHWRLNFDPVLELVDYKNGEGIGVLAYQNPQLLYYAALLIMGNPELRKLPMDFKVRLGIAQPNYWGAFQEIDVWETDIGTVHRFATQELLPAMNALVDDKRNMLPEDDFHPGDHCQFCPVMLECPRLRGSFELFANADEFVEMLSNQELSDLYARRPEARMYGNMIEKVVFARKMGGQEIPSAKLVVPQSNRVWKAGAEAAMRERFGEHALAPRKIKSPAALEKLSSDGKAFALEWGFKPDSDRLTVAPVSDRRAEAKPVGNAEIFKNFANETPLSDLGW